MSDEHKHSDLPWTCRTRREMDAEDRYIIRDKRNQFVTDLSCENRAALIVTACNSHYELVDALKECLEQNEGCFANHYGFYGEEPVTPEYITKARAALAKAGIKP